jgi:hypothetical protein
MYVRECLYTLPVIVSMCCRDMLSRLTGCDVCFCMSERDDGVGRKLRVRPLQDECFVVGNQHSTMGDPHRRALECQVFVA